MKLKKLFAWLVAPFIKWRGRYIMTKAKKQIEKAVNKQVEERKILRLNINTFLKDYFGIDANSKYIPKDYKNAEEVKTAIMTKFEPQMQRLHVNYEDLFK
ncbi:MAG TPA: hypothetical protein VLY84_00285 [Dysgonamonadaceae bacterium]|nr:hypothetical protein [Dysgonamonadaceae bacterium]